MKKSILLLFIISTINSKAQLWQVVTNPISNYSTVTITNTPGSSWWNSRIIISMPDSGKTNHLLEKWSLDSELVKPNFHGSVYRSLVLDDTGRIRVDTNRPASAYSTLTINGNTQDISTNRTWSVGTVTNIGLTSSDFSISGSPIINSGNITANLNTSGVTAGTYNGPVTVNNKGIVTAAINKTVHIPSRSLSTTGTNNTFTISSTQDAIVSYTVNFSASLTLTTSNGQVDLDYSLDGGSTWISVASVSQVFGASITITTNQNQVLSGVIPANALVRINRSQNTNSTPTLSTTRQQEYY